MQAFIAFFNPDAESSWVREQGLELAPPGEIYAAAMDWAMQTLTTVGYGNINPTTFDERIFVILGMVVGASAYAYILGSICTLVTGLMASTIEFQSRMDLLHEYMTDHKFTDEMRDRVNKFCFYSFGVNKALGSREHHIKQMFSPSMRRDIAYHIYGMRHPLPLPHCPAHTPSVDGALCVQAPFVRTVTTHSLVACLSTHPVDCTALQARQFRRSISSGAPRRPSSATSRRCCIT